MKIAIKEALKGSKLYDEVPVGAVIVKDNKVIAKAHNLKEKKNCSIFHAETNVIAKACKKLNDWRLYGCDIYVTLEPCPMCTGALVLSRIDNIYFGAYDLKSGSCGSLYNFVGDRRLNHFANVQGGILEEECAKMISDYFKTKRNKEEEKC